VTRSAAGVRVRTGSGGMDNMYVRGQKKSGGRVKAKKNAAETAGGAWRELPRNHGEIVGKKEQNLHGLQGVKHREAIETGTRRE